ncbi:MAG: hypothetical protein HYV09_18135 [Deltaproteobacteria bacterium]|nr:hypothetical protein [Deltaproteobacteria bacterium]
MSDNLHTDMPRPPSDTVQIAIRVPSDWLDRADKLIPRVARAGVAATRTDVFRAAIAKGFDAFDAEAREEQTYDVRRWRWFQRDLDKWIELTGIPNLSVTYDEPKRTAIITDGSRTRTHKFDDDIREELIAALEEWPSSRFYMDENGEMRQRPLRLSDRQRAVQERIAKRHK